jgi:hypothetical protein
VASDQIDKMAEGFKTLAEVKAYSSAQYSTIVKLNAKIKELNDEIVGLKNILAKSTPLLESDAKGLIVNPFEMSNEEMICLVQLNRLKEVSDDRLLTKEESQQLDIFTKNLVLIRNSPKTIRVESSKDLTEKELIALIEKSNESSS